MRRTALTAVALFGTLTLSACGSTPAAETPPQNQPAEQPAEPTGTGAVGGEGYAIAHGELRNPAGESRGTVEFVDVDGKTEIHVEASGLEPGFNGLHLHAIGKCEPDSPDPKDAAKTGNFLSAGGHLGDGEHPDHAGDLPPLLVGKDGTASLTVRTDRVDADTLLDDDGTAVMVHGGDDNFANIPERYAANGADDETKKAGDAGDRVACGTVQAP